MAAEAYRLVRRPVPRSSNKNEHLLRLEFHMPDRPSHTSKNLRRRPCALYCYAPVPLAVPCEITIVAVKPPELLPTIPSLLRESSATVLEWPRLREHIAGRTSSPLRRARLVALQPSSDAPWLDQQQQRTAEVHAMLT